MHKPVITCKGIKKTYGSGDHQVEALKDIDLDIYPECLTLIVGPSGSGKTTLLSILMTILTPDEGELIIFDKDIHTMSIDEKAEFRNQNLGIVFQSLFLIPSLSVIENVILPLTIAGTAENISLEKAQSLLDQLHIGQKANDPPEELSKGQQQRVAIARALVNDARILVCDEPTSALDESTGAESMKLLKAIAQNSGCAVVVVTHDQRTFPYANRIVELNDGRITSG
ncbi:MAG: ABC transporter ATP-binding protein [Parachlamydiales bacterium]|jgi:putative ABC transport system ATP-binding protein